MRGLGAVDGWTLLAIIAMAVITYATRVAGTALHGRLHLSPRATAAFDAIPPAVLVAVIAPSVLATGRAETVASVVTILAATRLPLLAVIVIGVVTIVALRALGV